MHSMEKETQKPRVYQLQTKLYHVEDVLVTWGPIRLTLRQCFVLILGGCGTLNVFRMLDFLSGATTSGLLLRIVLASLPSLLAVLFAVVKVADRYAEAWAWVLFEYLESARVYLSRPSLHKALQPKRKKQMRSQQDDETIQQEQQEEDE